MSVPRSPRLLLLSLCCCLLFLSLASPPSLALHADAAAAAAGRPAAPVSAAASDWSSDEFDGLDAEFAPPREYILEDDEQALGEIDGAAGASSSPSPLDVFDDPAASAAAAPDPRSFDADRAAIRLDWLHVHYEIRAIGAEDDDEAEKDADATAAGAAAAGRLLDSSRKLGRSPLVFQLGDGSATVLPEVEEAMLGAKIGEQRQVTLSAERSAALAADGSSALRPAVAAGKLRQGERLRLRLSLLRFDEDVRQLTMEDRCDHTHAHAATGKEATHCSRH